MCRKNKGWSPPTNVQFTLCYLAVCEYLQLCVKNSCLPVMEIVLALSCWWKRPSYQQRRVYLTFKIVHVYPLAISRRQKVSLTHGQFILPPLFPLPLELLVKHRKQANTIGVFVERHTRDEGETWCTNVGHQKTILLEPERFMYKNLLKLPVRILVVWLDLPIAFPSWIISVCENVD